jgi:hypothetical protein
VDKLKDGQQNPVAGENSRFEDSRTLIVVVEAALQREIGGRTEVWLAGGA